MLELCASALTIGAIFYRNLHFSLLILGLFAAVFVAFLSITVRTKRGVICAFLSGGACMLGALAVWYADSPVPRAVFGDRAFEAKVLSVDRRLTQTNLIVRDQATHRKIQITFKKQMDLLPGDIIAVHALVEAPESFTTATGRTFDYPNYLASKGIAGIGKNAFVERVQNGNVSLARFGTILRFRIADIFSSYLSFPADGVIAGMTVGYQGGIPQPVQDLFRNTGVLHVLVLSGYNITLLAGFLGLLLKGFPSKIRAVCIMGTIVLLVVVSGSGVASVRAGIMGSIALVSGLAVKKYNPFQALIFSYVFFFFHAPLMIFSDPGFHLSFLATAFMILVLPRVERLFLFIPKTNGVDTWELLMLAVSAPVFMLPYTMYFSGNFPLSSPIANIVMAVVTPIISIAAMVLLALAWVAPFAHMFGGLISAVMKLILQTLEFSARFPIWNTPAIGWWVVLVFYITLFLVLFRTEIRAHFLLLRNLFQRASSSSG